MKKCIKCNIEKTDVDFDINLKNLDGLRSACKSCCYPEVYVVPKQKLKDPEGFARKRQSQVLKRKYGISLADKLNMMEQQNGCCAICNDKLLSSSKSHVDHCHTTKKVREILCVPCNLMLGHAKDSTQILKNAVEYLKRHS